MADKTTLVSEWQYRVAYERHEPSYEALFMHFYKELTAFAFSYVKNSECAEEVVSDVMMKVWQMDSGLASVQNLRVYLFTATRNTAINYLRKNKRHATWDIENVDVELNMELYHPEAATLQVELRRKIATAIKDLPPKCQMVYKLIREDGLSYKEVAEILSISPKTVDVHFTKAMQRLREALKIYLR